MVKNCRRLASPMITTVFNRLFLIASFLCDRYEDAHLGVPMWVFLFVKSFRETDQNIEVACEP